MKLEEKSLKVNFMRFIIPSIVAQWVFTLYTIVDGIFVARGVSEAALTAVNICMPYTMALFAISITFAVGATTIVAIRLGEKNVKNASEIFSQNIIMMVVVSIVITVIAYWKMEELAVFLGATDYNKEYVCDYLGTLIPFSGAFVVSYSFEMLIKTDGFPQKATLIVTCGAALNVILDYIMVIRLPMGIMGAALATGISNTIVIILYLFHFLGKKGVIKFCRFSFDGGLILREFKNGLSSGITEVSSGFIIFVFNQAILRFLTEDALVSYTIISYLNALVVMTMVGISQGYQPLIGYFYGKKDVKSCRKLRKYGMAAVVACSVVFCGGIMAGAGKLVSLFIAETTSVLFVYSVKVFRIFALSFFVVGFNVVISGYFIAIEKSSFATIISLSRSIVMLLLVLFVMTALLGGAGIWWTPVISELLTLIISLIFMRKQKNQEKSVPYHPEEGR